MYTYEVTLFGMRPDARDESEHVEILSTHADGKTASAQAEIFLQTLEYGSENDGLVTLDDDLEYTVEILKYKDDNLVGGHEVGKIARK